MSNDDIEIRSGAIACLESLKIIEQIADNESSDWNLEQSFKAQQIAISSALLSAGDLPDKAKGVIAALVEYIYSSHAVGIPNLEKWWPQTSMNELEKETYNQFHFNKDDEFI